MYSGGESGHTFHTKPALFVSRITLYLVRSNRGMYVAAPTGEMERRGPYYNRLCRSVVGYIKKPPPLFRQRRSHCHGPPGRM